MNICVTIDALDLQEAGHTCIGMPFDERADDGGPCDKAMRVSIVRRLTQRARLQFSDAKLGKMIYDRRGIIGVLIRETPTCQFTDRAANVARAARARIRATSRAAWPSRYVGFTGARCIKLPVLLMGRDELSATERSDAKILRKYVRYELLVIYDRLTEDVENVATRFLLELMERRYMDHSTVICTQYAPAERHGRLGGSVQADAMIDRLVHGAVRIDLGDVNVSKLLSEKK